MTRTLTTAALLTLAWCSPALQGAPPAGASPSDQAEFASDAAQHPEAAPILVPAKLWWSHDAARIELQPLDVGDPSHENGLIVIRPIGPLSDPRLESVEQGVREQMIALWGDGAPQRYRESFARAMESAVDSVRSQRPSARVSVFGLPLESSSVAARDANAALSRLIESLDVLVSSRSFLRGGGQVLRGEEIRDALRVSVGLSAGRPILYRTAGGWGVLAGSPLPDHAPDERSFGVNVGRSREPRDRKQSGRLPPCGRRCAE